MKKSWKKISATIICIMLVGMTLLTGCGKSNKEVIIYSNADEEAITAMKNALDHNGYQGKYIVQSFGTSELGGKLLAEGNKMEADVVTMSSYYVQSAKEQNNMFMDLTFDTESLEGNPTYCTPITSQEGAIIINTELMNEYQLEIPTSIKDLAKPEYAGYISVTDIQSSSTAWLLVQALVNEYGEEETVEILSDIYQNAGDHIESSGSAPLKKVRAGEVAIGFGLRHQVVADKVSGLPIDYVDPIEGNFSLTESIAVLDKGSKTNELAMEMAECIIKNARAELIQYYPNPLYNGEVADPANISARPMVFGEGLTVELLERHKELSERAKAE